MTPYTLGLLATGLVMSFYWARVLKLVRKTRKKTGASAQLVPREPLGRALRIVWYPTVAVWVAHPWINVAWPTLLGGTELPAVLTPVVNTPLLWGPALAVLFAALWGTLVCWRRMGKSWRMGINPGEKTELVVSGPYAYVAHPIYALQQVLAVASLAVLPSPVMMAVAVIEVAFLNWEASREEIYLKQVHGEAYAGYRARVGRFIPRSWRAAV